jgi:hypothetical protein
MANVYATKAGDWSDITVWNTGALPTEADDVFSNNFIVQVDISTTTGSVSNGPASGIAAGGYFNMVAGVTLTLVSLSKINITTSGDAAATGGAVRASYLAPGASTIIASNGVAGVPSTSGRIGIVTSSTGTLNFIGDITGGAAISVGNTSVLNVTGNVLSGGGFGVANPPSGTTTSWATINFIGTIFAGGQLSASGSGSKVNITGNVTSSDTVVAVPVLESVNVNNITLSVIGTVVSNGATAVQNPAAGASDLLMSGPFINHGDVSAVYSRWLRLTSAPVTWDTFLLDGDGLPTVLNRLYNLGEDPAFPDEEDVRQGVDYGVEDTLTGTMIVPPASSVAKDVPVDATVGTADVTAADIWNHPVASITTAGSIGERLKNVATVQTVAEQVAALS